MPILGTDSNPMVKFAVGYAVTVVSGLMSYPIDTIRRRMMMTSGGDKSMMYKGSLDCAAQILKNEGFMSFMKGAGANILRGVAGAGVLSGFDELQGYYIKKMYPVRYSHPHSPILFFSTQKSTKWSTLNRMSPVMDVPVSRLIALRVLCASLSCSGGF